LESSFRAIRRSRPNARKMRRRVRALAGATDRRISSSTHIIVGALCKRTKMRDPGGISGKSVGKKS
jgi:hypothetical protein